MHFLKISRLAQILALPILAISLMPQAQAQPAAYPSKPVTVVMPVQAGTSSDVLFRLLAPKLSEGLKQSIVIENAPGAGGVIGAEKVARARPDGYTLGGFSDSTLQYAPHLASRVSFDPIGDFEAITFVTGFTWVLVTNPDFPATTLSEALTEIRKHPGKYSYASGGNGSPQHIAMEIFARDSGLALAHIPYKGTGQAIVDVVAGRVPMMFTGLGIVQGLINEGKLRAIAVPSRSRSVLLPQVPTFAEAGSPFLFSSWAALYAPKGTSKSIIVRLNQEIGTALADPAIRQKLEALAFEPRKSTPEELSEMTREGYFRMKAIIGSMNIKAD